MRIQQGYIHCMYIIMLVSVSVYSCLQFARRSGVLREAALYSELSVEQRMKVFRVSCTPRHPFPMLPNPLLA